MSLRAWIWIPLLASAACSVNGTVNNGYPPLVEGCTVASDCGPPYQCVDGGCEIQSCELTQECPAGFGCAHPVGDSQGQCLTCTPEICDAGVGDAG